jgi:hypothetical protein
MVATSVCCTQAALARSVNWHVCSGGKGPEINHRSLSELRPTIKMNLPSCVDVSDWGCLSKGAAGHGKKNVLRRPGKLTFGVQITAIWHLELSSDGILSKACHNEWTMPIINCFNWPCSCVLSLCTSSQTAGDGPSFTWSVGVFVESILHPR